MLTCNVYIKVLVAYWCSNGFRALSAREGTVGESRSFRSAGRCGALGCLQAISNHLNAAYIYIAGVKGQDSRSQVVLGRTGALEGLNAVCALPSSKLPADGLISQLSPLMQCAYRSPLLFQLMEVVLCRAVRCCLRALTLHRPLTNGHNVPVRRQSAT